MKLKLFFITISLLLKVNYTYASDDICQEIYDNIQHGKVNAVVDMIKGAGHKCNYNIRYGKAKEYPIWAAQWYPPVLASLLDAGANPNVSNRNDLFPGVNSTLLQSAVEGENMEVIKILLDHNADVNLHSKESPDTPLASAIKAGNVGITTMLLSKKPDLNDKSVAQAINTIESRSISRGLLGGDNYAQFYNAAAVLALKENPQFNFCNTDRDLINEYFFMAQSMSKRRPNDKKLQDVTKKLKLYSNDVGFVNSCTSFSKDESGASPKTSK